MAATQIQPILVGSAGATYREAVDLGALRAAHRARYGEQTAVSVDGNTAAAIPFLQWWRAPIVAGFPITPSTKWLEHIAAEVAGGKFDVDIEGKRVRPKRVKLLESEHTVADYIAGVAAACRGLVVGTATSSVGLDHMTETVRSLGASGLGNVMIVNVCRATANYPLCIEGDPSDTLAHRDDGFIQVCCRGKQQIYDTILQLPALGMHPDVLTPTMPVFYGIKDSHRSSRLVVEPDDAVNDFLDELLDESSEGKLPVLSDFLDAQGTSRLVPPGLLDGDTSMGACVTSAYFQGFKAGQKERHQRALEVLPEIGRRFTERFGRPGLEFFERHGMDDRPEVVLVCMGPDAGTAVHLLPELRRELGVRIGVVVMRLLTPFPSAALAQALDGVAAVGVVNNAHHHGRGHLTLDVADALLEGRRSVPVESFFCGLGGADVSVSTWRRIAEVTSQAARAGRAAKRWHLLHDGVELTKEG
jgi:pyruvate/2-oxoacid:ferredoxin oxidoreductase alpha subunit